MGTLNYEEITIESDVFQQARENFDMLLQRLFKKMEQNGSDEGSIALKVDINMETAWVDTKDGQEEIHRPTLKHKVTTAVPVKDSFDGKRDTGMNLVYDEELKRYVLKYVSVGGQRSIFDDDFQKNMNRPTEDTESAPGLPCPSNILPPPDDVGDVIEAQGEVITEETISDAGFTESEEEKHAEAHTEPSEADDDDYGYEEPEEE